MTQSSYRITDLTAREVLDCRGLPTVQVHIEFDGEHRGVADVPAGRSTGKNEAFELRDGGSRYGGFGVHKAVGNVRGEIREAVVGKDFSDQAGLDSFLIDLDATADKSRLGGNALVGVSMAASRGLAAAKGQPLYRQLGDGSTLPIPLVNLINGGLHASNDLDFQEFIVLPVGASTFAEALQLCSEVNLALASILLPVFGKVALNTGDEGGYAPPMSNPEQALGFLHQAVEKAGYTGLFSYGLDCASSHFYDADRGTYRVDGVDHERDSLIELYRTLVDDYGVVTIEDPLHEEDFEGFGICASELGIQIVGDDLFVTDADRVARGVEVSDTGALLLKVNQVGTLTEARRAADTARGAGYEIVVSERSGETEDPYIADLSVGIGAEQIKTGAPVRGERTSKYNRLLAIEAELGAEARYGSGHLRPEGS